MGTISGRLKTLAAMKSERRKEVRDSRKPTAISKIMPERNMLLISVVRPSAWYCAANRIMAAFIPQSLNTPINAGTLTIMPYRPYWSASSRRAMNIVPTEEIRVEIISPQSRWKLPLAEIFAMSEALLIVCPALFLTLLS